MVCHNRSHNLNHMKYFTFFFLLITLPTLAQTEAFYVQKLAQQLGGQTEVSVKNGRVDIVTDEYAIEVEWANNWKHSIGQALWYSIQTNKKAGIILIMKDEGDYKYGIMLQSTIDYAQIGDKIKVWFYPQDFGGSFESQKLEEKNIEMIWMKRVVIIGLLIQQRSVITSHAINLENQKVIVGHPVMVKRVRSAEVSYIFIHA